MKRQRIKGASTEGYEIVLSRHEYDRLVAENGRLRAELAAIKPDWSNAPEWVHSISIRSVWLGDYEEDSEEYEINAGFLYWKSDVITDYTEPRPAGES